MSVELFNYYYYYLDFPFDVPAENSLPPRNAHQAINPLDSIHSFSITVTASRPQRFRAKVMQMCPKSHKYRSDDSAAVDFFVVRVGLEELAQNCIQFIVVVGAHADRLHELVQHGHAVLEHRALRIVKGLLGRKRNLRYRWKLDKVQSGHY